MYGSQSELVAKGIEPKRLLGLMSQTDMKKDEDQFSINIQDEGELVRTFFF